MKLRIFYSRS